MKSLAEIIYEIISAERRRWLQDAVNFKMKHCDCQLTGSAVFADYDPCFVELLTIEKMN